MGDLLDDDLLLLSMGDYSSDDDLLALPELDSLFADDDPDVLRAALDFIEACDSSSDDSEHSAASVASPPPAAIEITEAQAPVAKPRRVTRNRRKEEIAELRVLVAQLETQVASRKRKLYVPETLPFATIASAAHDDVVAAMTSENHVLWEHISKRQQQQRQFAEIENAKLRNMVMDQLKVARELTRVAKRRALIEGRSIDAFDDLEMLEPLAPTPNESPLMVRIYPSRPGMTARVGMAMPLSDAKTDELTCADAADLEGTPVGAAWKPSAAVAMDQSQATRLAWQATLRYVLSRRRVTPSHERGNEILDAAIRSSLKEKTLLGGPALVYGASRVSSTKTNAMWQKSPSTLLGSYSKTALNLRLFRLDKPVARSDTLDDVTSRLGRLSLLKPTLPQSTSLQKWQSTTSCF